jgi:hypothetical protein
MTRIIFSGSLGIELEFFILYAMVGAIEGNTLKMYYLSILFLVINKIRVHVQVFTEPGRF